MTRTCISAAGFALLLLGTASAQDTSGDNTTTAGNAPLTAQASNDAAGADNSAATAETNDAGAVSNTQEAQGDDAAGDGEQESRPINASTDVFVPTEEVSFDKSISMPVDI